MLSCGVVGCGVAWWDMVVCAYIYMCVYVCVSVVHDTRYDMTFQIKQKSISLTTAVQATNKNKKSHQEVHAGLSPGLQEIPPMFPPAGPRSSPAGLLFTPSSRITLSLPLRGTRAWAHGEKIVVNAGFQASI